MAHHFKIRSIPSVLILNNEDEILHTFVGVQSKQTYVDALKMTQENTTANGK
jgi:hypothetical protein